MNIMKFPITCDTNVSRYYPYDNFNNCLCLYSKAQNCMPISNILFKISNSLFHYLENFKIIDAKLCFKIINYNKRLFDLRLYENLSDYNCKTVTWNTTPNSLHICPCTFNSTTNCIEFNISNIILNLSNPNYGFQIISYSKNSKILLGSSRSQCPPYLELKLTPLKLTSKYLLSYIDNSSNSSSLSIPNNDIVPFNAVATSNILKLDKNKGSILISKPGVYSIDWWINYSGSISTNSIRLSLRKSPLITIYSSSCPSNSPGFLSGHAIFKISSSEALSNCAISLYNTSDVLNEGNSAGTLYLSATDMPASIRVSSLQ